MPADDLLIRNVEIAGRAGLDVRMRGGLVAEIGSRLAGGARAFDGRGGALIPGLHDHHIHLLALAAQADSVRLEGAHNAVEVSALLRAIAAARAPGEWIRATGYHERIGGELTRAALDAVAPNHKLRVQHQTGSLWTLNSRALDAVLTGDDPVCVERDASGRATGRIWRGDDWLRTRIKPSPPSLAPVGRALAEHGVTGVTDATVTTDAESAALLAGAARENLLSLRLTLMSGGALAAPEDGAFSVGPVKIVLDEHDLPDLAYIGAIIARARDWRRPVAVHCVTAAELALMLAAFETFGAEAGDRIEHGGVIAEAAIPALKKLGLTVVTQPAFIYERGDRYLAEIPPAEHGDLYRCASLLNAGVPVAASSDAPYAAPHPWRAVAAAMTRRSRAGEPVGQDERVDGATALALFMASGDNAGGPARRIAEHAPADFCLLKTSLREALAAPSADLVAATFLRGSPIYEAR